MSLLRTPPSIDAAVLDLADHIGSASRPVYLDIAPEKDSELLDCFRNVQRKIARDGGRMQTGWSIWLWPRVYIEAEHHGVYDPGDGGALKDLTPASVPGMTRRLFLPDDAAVYDFAKESVRRDNIRLGLTKDPSVGRFFRAAERRNEILNVVPGLGLVSISGAVAAEYEALESEMIQLQGHLILKYTKVNDPCPCGSGQKFKRCHGRVA